MGSRNPMPEGRWREAMQRAGFRCEASSYGLGGPCDGPLIVHHRIIRGMGSTRDESIHDLDNLAVLCDFAHHRHVHANPAEAYELGLLVRRNSVHQG